MSDKSSELEIRPIDSDIPSPQNIVPQFPEELKEFGKIPQSLVSVYTAAPYWDLEAISQDGLKIEKSKVKLRTNEAIFTEQRPSSITVDRTNCIFAVPPPPDQSTIITPNVIRKDYLEVMVNPKTAVVTDVAIYNEAHALRVEDYFGTVEQVGEKAREYWNKAVTLEEFLKEGNQKLRDSFEDPEVLIPDNIPPSRIKIFRLKE